jgi:cobyrinic acid a,c-diamide synthase
VVSLPRLVVAAPASGHGKTTIATGVMAALRRRGLEVSGHKVGPDYIDPGYHELATGRPGRNLDPFLVGEQRLVPLLLHAAEGADVAVVEGVMGLFDGQLGAAGFASTAHVATVTRSPVLLVVDVSHMSRSVAAVVHGMRGFDPAVHVAAVVLNKAGSQRHAREVLAALDDTGLPVLGVVQRDDGVVAPSRHLGLVPVAERPAAAAELEALAERVGASLDLDALLDLARTAPDLAAAAWRPEDEVRPGGSARPVVAVAAGRAFTFRYAETTELLRAAGCEVAEFDPLTDTALPTGTRGIYLGGGFPEVYAGDLAGNARLRAELRDAVSSGVPTVAECAGLLYLCRSLDDHPMVGAVPADARMGPRRTLGYRSAVVPDDQLTGPTGTRVHGHEFHRTVTSPPAGELPAYLVDGVPYGFGHAGLVASYLHVHWAGHPEVAQRFADAVHRGQESPDAWQRPAPARTTAPPAGTRRPPTDVTDPLLHHGDREVAPGLLDFAVNVHADGPPDWLLDALRTSLAHVHEYPDPWAAQEALAAQHHRRAEEILVTSGGAEAFTLLARARAWRHPVVVHPQFTEPEAALRAAGLVPTRVLCREDDGFALTDDVPADADLVLLGNPTNPTAVLHPASVVRGLLRPGRVVVVDEAFLDTVPGEPGSLADSRLPGLLVVRSLTKLWAVPGVRAGYVLGDTDVVARLRRQQPPWSVSTAATAAVLATTTARATAERHRRARALAADRDHLCRGLDALGVPHVPGVGAFVLARVPAGTHARLRAAGVAVRRCDTFPGLDDTWIRIAVRPPDRADRLLGALAAAVPAPVAEVTR